MLLADEVKDRLPELGTHQFALRVKCQAAEPVYILRSLLEKREEWRCPPRVVVDGDIKKA